MIEGSTQRVAEDRVGGSELEVRVERRDVVADDVISLTISHLAGDQLPIWNPGAHVDILLDGGGERQYSLCGDPDDRQRWRVAVLREPRSRGGSKWIHENVHAGDELRVRGPRNHFELVEADTYIFIGGGIGVTPLLPMIRSVVARGCDWSLLYGGRRSSSMAFLSELEPHGSHVTVWPEDTLGLLPLVERIGEPRARTAVYCCGPESLIDAVEKQCVTWPSGSLHVERFRPRPDSSPGSTSEFQVELARSGKVVTVQAGESIVDALEKVGVEVSTSCREGTCGTCETTVIEGVPDHRDSVLTQSERDANDAMMLCCSRSLSRRLVLDL